MEMNTLIIIHCSFVDTVNSPTLVLRLQREPHLTPLVTVTMQFSSLYPEQPPTISCQCEDRLLSQKLITCLTELSLQLQGSAMVCAILSQAQEILNQQGSMEGM